MLARERSEVMSVAAECASLVEKLIELESQGNTTLQKQARSVTAIIKFTDKEAQMMSYTFKKEFIANGLAAHVLKKESGKNSFCYEIRYRSNGFNIIASSTDLAEAKRKFLAKTVPSEIEKYRVQKRKTGINLLEEVFGEWHRYKNGTITEKELKRFYVNFQALPETLRKKPIASIRTGDIDAVLKEVKPRKYEELRTLFNGIFKYAVASGIIQHNPVALIKFKRAERQTRDALSEEEIYDFLKRVELPEFDSIRQGAYLLYFFGLRPCEIDEETHREGDFLIARNRKRKNGKIEYKKIPIPLQAQGLIDWDKPLVFNCSNWKRNNLFNALLGNSENTTYCLRHTFSTICQEHLNRPDIVDVWMGDSPQRLVGKVYTHFSDKFMRSQMHMVKFPTLESLEE
jgi:integrase